jgi:hypothetical protein
MAIDQLTAAEWWEFDPEADTGRRIAVEAAAEGDEVQVTLRGLDGDDPAGSFYLSTRSARALAGAIQEAALEVMAERETEPDEGDSQCPRS